MSTKYSPNLSRDEMEKILLEEDTGCLALCDGEWPYVVPVSYAFIDGAIVIHGATTGRKLSLIQANPRANFLVSRHPDRIQAHHPDSECSFRFESVLCQGRASIILDAQERLDWLRRFKGHFDKRLGSGPNAEPVTEKAAENCSCIVMTIEHMTGRQKKGKTEAS